MEDVTVRQRTVLKLSHNFLVRPQVSTKEIYTGLITLIQERINLIWNKVQRRAARMIKGMESIIRRKEAMRIYRFKLCKKKAKNLLVNHGSKCQKGREELLKLRVHFVQEQVGTKWSQIFLTGN